MALKVVDTGVFVAALQCMSRFVEKAHFDIHGNGLRIRSIDPHDFCYADLRFGSAFFDGGDSKSNAKMGIDVRKFYRILSAISRASEIRIGFDEDGLSLNGLRGWTLGYHVARLQEDPYDLPEPNPMRYRGSVELSSKEFCELTDAASAISNELTYRISKDGFWIEAASGDYQLSARPSRTAVVHNPSKEILESKLIANYVRSMEPLIRKCDKVSIRLDNGKPIELALQYSNKGTFSFSFSPRKSEPKRQSRKGISLPRLTVSKFPEFLAYLGNSPLGEELRIMKLGHLETAGGDYNRLGKILGLVEGRKKITLTKEGVFFVNVLKSDTNQAALLLNKLLLTRVQPYITMIRLLEKRPMDPNDLYTALNSKSRKVVADRQDVSTMLGLAMWCNVIDRRMSLYYFGRKERSKSD